MDVGAECKRHEDRWGHCEEREKSGGLGEFGDQVECLVVPLAELRFVEEVGARLGKAQREVAVKQGGEKQSAQGHRAETAVL